MERSIGDTPLTAPYLAEHFQNDAEIVTRADVIGVRDPALVDPNVFRPPPPTTKSTPASSAP
jgi:hypothetical protein